MAIFDFLKRKPNPANELKQWMDKPEVRKAKLQVRQEYVQKQAANLRAVGRGKDALAAIVEYLCEILAEWGREPDNPANITLLANAAITLNALDYGKDALKSVIQANDKIHKMDLTTVYLDLGRVYHQLRADREKELWCYHTATEAAPPPGCRFPATPRQKAKCHYFAYSCAAVMGNKEHEQWHIYKAKELAPEVNWDDPEALIKFIQST